MLSTSSGSTAPKKSLHNRDNRLLDLRNGHIHSLFESASLYAFLCNQLRDFGLLHELCDRHVNDLFHAIRSVISEDCCHLWMYSQTTNRVSTKSATDGEWSAWFVVKTMTVSVCLRSPYFRSCSMKTPLANDFAVVRLKKKKEGTFYYGLNSGRGIIFLRF